MWLLISALCAQSAAAKAVAREVVEALEPRVVRAVEAYGDDAARALRVGGAAALPALEAHGATAARFLARFGDDGARLLAAEGDAVVTLFAKHGDEAVAFMLKHPGVGRDLVEAFGAQAARANVTTGGVVLMNRMAEPIRASGRAAEIFGVVERFGDRACAFLWRNKGAVFGAALLTAFLADPEPYIEGAKRLVVEPMAGAARNVAARTDWTWVFAATGVALVAWAAWRLRRRTA
ncbi:MAG TPA: hypothetical protein VF950_18070 [Planctomycetota bacterium]